MDPGRGRRLRWEPGWRRFGVADWITTIAAGAATVGFAVIGPPVHRSARLGVDESVRDVLRSSAEQERYFAADASDVLLSLLEAYNFLLDALIVTAWYRDSPAVGWQMALVDLETLVITSALQGAANFAIGRERPYGRDCAPDDQWRDCATDRYRSFFSGHTSQAFTSAALLCGNHARMPLYGGGVADLVPCLGGLAAAGTVGLLRIAADKHYFTDVMTGAALGTTVGFLVPWLLHYLHGAGSEGRARRGPRRSAVSWVPAPVDRGVGAVGVFE